MRQPKSELSITLEDYIKNYLMITTKDGDLVHLCPNEAQQRLYDTFKEKYNNDEPCKVIILKARQLGISTMTEAIISAKAMTDYYTNCLIVAHDGDSTSHIFDMAKRYYDNLPSPLKPMLKHNNAKMLDFQNPSNDPTAKEKNPGLRSSIRVATAGKSGVGRSQTFQYIHLSELAFWEETDGKTIQSQLTGILNTLPQHGSSLLVIESTANGFNYFKTLWDQAVNGENDFIPLFFPWYEMKEYRKPWHGEEFTAEEKQEIDKYGLDNEQIMWRRYAIRNLSGNSIDQFRQEYPACPEEAFILTGTPFFNADTITKRLATIKKPIVKGIYSFTGEFIEDDAGAVEIWERPKPDHTYCIGCDTAGEGSDFFVSYVIDKTDGGVCVAKYRSKTDEVLFARQMFFLGVEYNLALIAVETNFSTYTVLKLQEMGYPNLYVREQVDTYTYHAQKKFGFRTTSLTRPLILDNLKEIVNDHSELINDETFFNECLSFAKDDKGKPQAASNAHDDCVMAMAIAYYCMPQAQSSNGFVPEEDEEPSEYNSFINYGD